MPRPPHFRHGLPVGGVPHACSGHGAGRELPPARFYSGILIRQVPGVKFATLLDIEIEHGARAAIVGHDGRRSMTGRGPLLRLAASRPAW